MNFLKVASCSARPTCIRGRRAATCSRARCAIWRTAAGRLAHDLGDLVVGCLEHLVQHEHGPLGRTEGLQYREHRDRDVLGELGVLGHIGTGEQRLGQPFPDVVLPLAGHRSEPVQRLPGHHPDQIRPRVTHLCMVHVGPPQPGLLDYVLGVDR